jgi:hypothetical protein
MSREADMVDRAVRAAALGALESSVLDLQGRAQRDAPVDEGTLRGSATHSITVLPDGSAFGTVEFPLVYAAVQEREDDFLHPRGGKAHYLGDNLKAMAPVYKAALEIAVNKVT